MSTAAVAEPITSDVGLEKKLNSVSLTDPQPVEDKPSSVAASSQETPAGPRKIPFTDPLPSVEIPPPQILTADQQSKYDTVLKEVKSWTEIPSTEGKEGPITDAERMWLTQECLLRYLRATKWSTADATKRLLGTLTWRREYGVEEVVTADHVSPENETGKQVIVGYDIAGRPCQYLNPGRQNTEVSPRQIQHLVYMLERVIELGVPGQETLTLLINFKQSKTRSNTAPSLSTGRNALHILQTHYPERLGRALILNVPWVVWGFFKLITPFIDPLTREKLKFNGDMRQHVPAEQLWNECGGDLDFEYDHSVYWPALAKICEEKRAAATERWIQGGKQVGESEFYLKGGNGQSVGRPAEVPVLEKATEGLPVEPKQEVTA